MTQTQQCSGETSCVSIWPLLLDQEADTACGGRPFSPSSPSIPQPESASEGADTSFNSSIGLSCVFLLASLLLALVVLPTWGMLMCCRYLFGAKQPLTTRTSRWWSGNRHMKVSEHYPFTFAAAALGPHVLPHSLCPHVRFRGAWH